MRLTSTLKLKNSVDNFKSNETLALALVSIVLLERIFERFFTVQESQKIELLCFSYDLGEIGFGANIGQRTR